MDAPLATEWKKTACIICSLNCGLEVQTEGGRIVDDLQDPSGAYPETTSVLELPDRHLPAQCRHRNKLLHCGDLSGRVVHDDRCDSHIEHCVPVVPGQCNVPVAGGCNSM